MVVVMVMVLLLALVNVVERRVVMVSIMGLMCGRNIGGGLSTGTVIVRNVISLRVLFVRWELRIGRRIGRWRRVHQKGTHDH